MTTSSPNVSVFTCRQRDVGAVPSVEFGRLVGDSASVDRQNGSRSRVVRTHLRIHRMHDRIDALRR